MTHEKKGPAVFLEHIPDLQYANSTNGVLFIVYNNGDGYFFPLSKATEANVFMSSARSVTSAKENSACTVYDVLMDATNLHFVFHFRFVIQSEDGMLQVPPRKMLLSHDKKLLLVLGALPSKLDCSCLIIYSVTTQQQEGKLVFKEIYYDLSLTYIDACFSSDSKSLLVIPSRFPSNIFMLRLPSRLHAHETISFDPRSCGPILIAGPARGFYGQPLLMTHIAASGVGYNGDTCTFLTWNDEGNAEYCLWQIDGKEIAEYSFFPQQLIAVTDQEWLKLRHTPKHFILDAQFSPCGKKLGFVVHRSNYEKESDNGIGMQVVDLSLLFPKNSASPHFSYVDLPFACCWYNICPISKDSTSVLCAKWTNTLAVGTHPSFSVFIKDLGLFELVDFKYASAFQDLFDDFCQNICVFTTLGKFQRYWIKNNGELRCLVVSLDSGLKFPEWSEFQSHSEVLNMRMLAKRVGYYIKNIETEKDEQKLLANIYSSLKKNLKSPSKVQNKPITSRKEMVKGKGKTKKLVGAHLYRCGYCSRTLVKPMRCSSCKSVVYCGKDCQSAHWKDHREQCKKPPDKSINS